MLLALERNTSSVCIEGEPILELQNAIGPSYTILRSFWRKLTLSWLTLLQYAIGPSYTIYRKSSGKLTPLYVINGMLLALAI